MLAGESIAFGKYVHPSSWLNYNSSKENYTYHPYIIRQRINKIQTHKLSKGAKRIIALHANYRLHLSLDPNNHPWFDLPWSLLYKANEAWCKRDTLIAYIIHRTSSIPWDACHSLGSQAVEDIQFLWDMQQSPDFA